MANQHGVAFVCIERAVGFHHQVETGQHLAVLQRQRGFERDFLRANQPDAVGFYHGLGIGMGKGKWLL